MIVAESSRAAAPLEDVVVVVVGARVVVEAAVVVELASPWPEHIGATLGLELAFTRFYGV